MNVETRLKLDKFQLRPYQMEIWHAIENLGYKKLLAVMPRRSGKDLTCFNLAIRYALRKPCLIYYCLPTYSQARKVLFDGITSTGERFLDYIPKEVIKSVNSQMMRIEFQNQSILQLLGSDSYNTSLVGTNPYMIIFSEWSRAMPQAYEFARPILAANGGIAIFVSTPYGKNHMWHMHETVKNLPDWYVIHKKTSEIRHIDEDALMLEREQMSPELYAQEYECEYSRGVDGSIYAKILNKMRADGQIGFVPYEVGLPVYTAWDIGISDPGAIVFFQLVNKGAVIRVIDAYSAKNLGMTDFIKFVMNKDYVYAEHLAPHDIKVREWGSGGLSRLEMARQLGFNFTLVPASSIADGIEGVRLMLPKCLIDEKKCASMLNALENYQYVYNEQKDMYEEKPLHNWSSHYADVFRLIAASLPKLQPATSPDEFRRRKAEALYASQKNNRPTQWQRQTPY